MLEDVLDAARAVGRVFVVALDEQALPDDVDRVTDPRHGQGAAVRAALDAAVSAGSRAPYLVVNADLPCVTARDLLALAGRFPRRDSRWRPQPTAPRTRSGSPTSGCSLRSTAQGARSGTRRSARRVSSRRRISSMTWTRSTICTAWPHGSGRTRGACSQPCAARRPRERRSPLGRRRRRAVPARPRRCSRSRQRFHRRQRRGRHRGARAPRLPGPGQHPLHAHRSLRRGTRLGSCRRELARPRDRRRAGRRVVVPPRRPRPRPPSRPHAAPARGRDALRSNGTDCACARTRTRAAPCHQRPGPHVSRDAGRDASVSDVVRRARSPGRGRCRALRRLAGGGRSAPV